METVILSEVLRIHPQDSSMNSNIITHQANKTIGLGMYISYLLSMIKMHTTTLLEPSAWTGWTKWLIVRSKLVLLRSTTSVNSKLRHQLFYKCKILRSRNLIMWLWSKFHNFYLQRIPPSILNIQNLTCVSLLLAFPNKGKQEAAEPGYEIVCKVWMGVSRWIKDLSPLYGKSFVRISEMVYMKTC